MASWLCATCETNGVDIHYLRAGSRGTDSIVLLHGLTANGACWTPMTRVLEGEYDVVMPDARGHGESSAPAHGYGYDEHAKDVEGLIARLALRRPVLIGHSMGGMTAALVARRRVASIRAVVLIDPTFLSPDRQREVYESDTVDVQRRLLASGRSELVTQTLAKHPRRSREIVELLVDAKLKTSIAAFEVLRPPNPDYRDVVRDIGVRILVVIGDTNPVVTIEIAEEMRRMNSRVRIEQVHDAGHGLPFDQPERIAAIVASFLRELD